MVSGGNDVCLDNVETVPMYVDQSYWDQATADLSAYDTLVVQSPELQRAPARENLLETPPKVPEQHSLSLPTLRFSPVRDVPGPHSVFPAMPPSPKTAIAPSTPDAIPPGQPVAPTPPDTVSPVQARCASTKNMFSLAPDPSPIKH